MANVTLRGLALGLARIEVEDMFFDQSNAAEPIDEAY